MKAAQPVTAGYGRYPSVWSIIFLAAGLVCFVHVQVSLHNNRVEMHDILTENMEKQHQQSMDKDSSKVLPKRAKRSVPHPSTTNQNDSYGDLHSIISMLIRQEVSKQLQQLLKTQVCVCPTGPPRRPGPPGSKGDPGPSVSAATISTPPQSITVNETNTASLHCGASGYPVPKVTWKKVNSSLPSGRYVLDNNGGLIIRNVSKTDQGSYQCTAKNIFPGEATSIATITVLYGAKIIQWRPSSIVAYEDKTINFACTAQGSPKPVVMWSKAFSSLPMHRHTISEHISADDTLTSTLTLRNLTLNDQGRFMCTARNKLDTDSKTAELIVTAPIIFKVAPPHTLSVIEGDNLMIDCQATNADFVSWEKPPSRPRAKNWRVYGNGSFAITRATSLNQGTYKCIARNSYKQASVTTLVVVADKTCHGLVNSTILAFSGSLQRYCRDLVSLLAPVQRSMSSRWVRCWHAVSDGWDVSKTFHPQCDNKGPTVTIVRFGKEVFGGYTDKSWISRYNGYITSTKSFLFYLYGRNGYQPNKLPLTDTWTQHQYAIYRSKYYGPLFGAGHDLHISNNAGNNKKSYRRTYSYRSKIPGYSFSKKSYFTPNNVEVFYETT